MDRRKALKVSAGIAAVGGAFTIAAANVFKTKPQPGEEPHKLEYKKEEHSWDYHPLDPVTAAELAYKNYDVGSCMYATFTSILSQLSDKYDAPYNSFPIHMMKYGHGGVGGFGSVCGTLNGAASLIGLFVIDKKIVDSLITGLFRWYEKNQLPEFKPQNAVLDYTPQTSSSGSILCHASITNWGKESGQKAQSKERKERCRRLTADVAARITHILNDYFSNNYITIGHDDETARTCMTCHGSEGKLDNTAGKMTCTTCHDKSLAHKVFADGHYKLMKEQ